MTQRCRRNSADCCRAQPQIALIRLLLKAGADPDRADNSGRTARDYAALDGRNSPLLAEIESARQAARAAPKAVRPLMAHRSDTMAQADRHDA